jgi:hypothetical protein
VNINFGPTYGSGVNGSASRFLPAPLDWTGKTRLHISVKVEVPGGPHSTDYLAINGYQGYIFSGGYSVYTPSDQFVGIGYSVNSPAADGAWHEMTIGLAVCPEGGTTPGCNPRGPSVVANMVDGFGVQLLLASTQATGAPAIPPMATLLIDDIWLE